MNEKKPVSLKDEAINLLVAEAAELFEKDPAAGWRDCQKILQLDPTRHEAFFYGAQALFYLGRYKESQELLMRAPKECREDPLTKWSLACTQVALGLLKEATANARQAIRKDPKLKARMLKDTDLEPIWAELGSEEQEASTPAQTVGTAVSKSALAAPESKARIRNESQKRSEQVKPSEGSRIEKLNAALAKLKSVPRPQEILGASCYMPARPRGRTEMASMVVSAGATGEGVTLTYLCGRCTRRTHYRVGQAPPPRRGLLSFLGGKTTPAPAPEHYISTTDAELIQQTIYPNRRALAELPKNIAVDETHFCPHCRQSPPPPQLLVNYRCPTCSRTTVYHVDSSPQPEPAKVTPRVAPIMHSRMSAKELRNSFVELAKLKAGLGELGSDFELETTMFCWACGGGKTPRPALKWELTQGQPKILRVGHADLALLKKFVSSLHLPLEQQPKWMHSEAEKIEAMFK